MNECPYLVGPYAPTATEESASSFEVVGEIPRDVDGVYLRNGPNPKHAPKGRYHWFDGDAMIHAAEIRDGKITYRRRWVATPELADETQAGKALWTGLMEPLTGNPRLGYKDTGNTDIVFHNGVALALWYLTGKAYAIDPITLETKGPERFGQAKPLRMSAHAKVDEQTGELFFFEYGPMPPFMHYGVVGRDGVLAHRQPIELPGPRLPHDMAITEHFAILMDLPICFRDDALAQGKWGVEFRRDLPARYAVVPRQGGAARFFEAESAYVYHVVNAWEEGHEIVMIGCRVDDPIPEPDPADGPWARALANLRVRAKLHEWRFNLETGATKERTIDDRNTDFPSVDRSRVGRKTRFSYNMSLEVKTTTFFDGIVKYDLETGKSESLRFGDGLYGSESSFAPRTKRSAEASAEDDGYLFTFVQDTRVEANGASELWIIDARDVAKGPVARVKMPSRVPIGFHATWVSRAAIERGPAPRAS